jgi:hypothetical protein
MESTWDILAEPSILLENNELLFKVDFPKTDKLKICVKRKSKKKCRLPFWALNFAMKSTTKMYRIMSSSEDRFEMGLFDSHGQIMKNYLKIAREEEPENFIKKVILTRH